MDLELELEADLAEALGGFDPMELLLQDPELNIVASEVFNDAAAAADLNPEVSLAVEEDSDACSETAFENLTKKPLLPCVVCGCPTKPARYCGVHACLSCRAFFVRSKRNDAHLSFVCLTGKLECSIHSRSWMSCQWCRFYKCLKAGMQVKIKTASINNVGSGPKRQDKGRDVRAMLVTPSQTMSWAEEKQLQHFCQSQLVTGNQVVLTLVLRDMSIFKSLMEFYFKKSPYNLKTQKIVYDYLAFTGAKMVKNGEALPRDDLTSKDRSKLASSNFPMLTELIMAYRMWKVDDIESDVASLVEKLCITSTDQDCTKEIRRIHKDASKNGKLKPSSGTYERLYDRNEFDFASPELLERHKSTALRLARLGGYKPREAWDQVHCFLTFCITFYSCDFLDLDEPGKATKLQTAYASLLYK